MSGIVLASTILAAVAVLGSLLGMASVVYRMGQLTGRVEEVIKQRGEDIARLDRAILAIATAQASHENWHRGPYSQRG